MRSSGSTRSPRPDRPFRLLVVLAGEDHPKACTGRRLLRWRRAVSATGKERSDPLPIVLDPYAPTPLSALDREAAARGGLLALDCSWNRLSARGRLPALGIGRRGRAPHRRLPFLVATNPQHYGHVAQLNTVEALSAAVFLLGRAEQAERLVAGFRGEGEFLRVNRERLERYRAATTPADVRAAERSLFAEG